ncbi:MAG TPA: acyl-CoA thioesterase domain-containing protein [Mycobacterium sp.]|nr:acyl-CoA thioesterase domain-containing protein [Mycobacterium sp.]
MTDLWFDLLDCLELHPADSAGTFMGRNQQLQYHRVFGGQILAQFLTVARLTCPDKAVKSLHCLFAKEGRADEELRYDAQRQHDGRTFATLTISATQSTGVIATATVAMHAGEDGPDRQTVDDVPAVPGPQFRRSIGMIPWEIRAETELDDDGVAAPEYEMWMRTPEVSPDRAPALAAYATDLTLIGTALRPIPDATQRGAQSAFASAVTSHTVWFHRPFVTDSWLLLRQHSPILAHSRAFGRGDVLTADGLLVASYAQESLVRFAQ